MKFGIQPGFAVSDISRPWAAFQKIDFCLVSIVVTANDL